MALKARLDNAALSKICAERNKRDQIRLVSTDVAPLLGPKKSTSLVGSVSFNTKPTASFTLYCVTLRDHPDVFKLGRTYNWPARSLEYRNWNLRDGDGILCGQTFTINEEYCDLPSLEQALIADCPFPLFRGLEWFKGENEEACRYVDRYLTASELCFEAEFV